MHAVLYMIDGGVAVILNKYISDFYLRFTNEFRGSLGIWVLSFSLSLCPFLCFLFDLYFPCDLILSNTDAKCKY